VTPLNKRRTRQYPEEVKTRKEKERKEETQDKTTQDNTANRKTKTGL
jgi:hypothetical protein